MKKPEVEVTEEEIDNEVKRIQDRYADWVIREDEEPAQIGDQVTIDFVGEKDGVPFEGGAGNDYPLVLGSNTFIPGFEDQLVGVKAGEEKDIEVTFPENYQAPDLAGQAVIFKVKVHDVNVKSSIQLLLSVFQPLNYILKCCPRIVCILRSRKLCQLIIP